MGTSSSGFNISNCSSQNTTTTIELNLTTVITYEYTSFETMLIVYILPCGLFLCLSGNLSFFFTIFRVKRMQNNTNLYLINLSLADICFLGVVVGEKTYRYYTTKVPSYGNLLGTWGCGLMYLCVYTTYFMSLFIVTSISVERYFAICMPLKHMIVWKKKSTVRMVVGSWFLSVIVASTVLIGYVKLSLTCIIWPNNGDFEGYPNVIGECGSYGTRASAYENFAQTFPFFVAVVTNVTLYTLIILKMKDRTKINRESTSSVVTRVKLLKARNQVCRMLIINGIVFFSCQAPYEVSRLVDFMQIVTNSTGGLLTDDQYRTFLWAARLLLYLNAMINPFVFGATSPSYRRAFKAAFTCHLHKSTSRSSRILDDASETWNNFLHCHELGISNMIPRVN